MLRVILLSAGLASMVPSTAQARGNSRAHVVQAGQSLWEIARTYGCEVHAIKEANDLEDKLIYPGQELAIPRCDGPRGDEPRGAGRRASGPILSHVVSEGDTLYELARRYDTSVDDLRRRNRLQGNRIKPGQTLRVAVGKDGQGRPIPGQSVGSASRGQLVDGMQLPKGRGYYRRRPSRAWGANHTIHHVRRAVSVVRARLPRVHDLAIGDISAAKGGPLADHRSHQSGRDVDIGLYYKKVPNGYPQSFIRADAHDLDPRATWMLIETLADTEPSASGVEVMFLDYALQKVLYEWAKDNGVSRAKLKRVFQYPRGEGSLSGVVRHEPGHDTHVHVRFKCPKNDSGCR